MNKYYFIAPGVLLAGFVAYEHNYDRHRREAQAIATARVEAAQAAEKARLAALSKTVAEETAARVARREQDERERTERKRRDAEAVLNEIEHDAATHAAEAAKLAREAELVESQLAELRARKQKLADAAFALERDVAEHRIDRRTTELELQRTTKMVATRLLDSPWSQATPIPRAAAGK